MVVAMAFGSTLAAPLSDEGPPPTVTPPAAPTQSDEPPAGLTHATDRHGASFRDRSGRTETTGFIPRFNSSVAPGASGSITPASTGRYGELAGKAVAVEPATGFTFDSALARRPR